MIMMIICDTLADPPTPNPYKLWLNIYNKRYKNLIYLEAFNVYLGVLRIFHSSSVYVYPALTLWYAFVPAIFNFESGHIYRMCCNICAWMPYYVHSAVRYLFLKIPLCYQIFIYNMQGGGCSTSLPISVYLVSTRAICELFLVYNDL